MDSPTSFAPRHRSASRHRRHILLRIPLCIPLRTPQEHQQEQYYSTPCPTPPTPAVDSNSGMSTGELIGIIAGSIVCVGGVAIATVVFFCRRRQRDSRNADDDAEKEEERLSEDDTKVKTEEKTKVFDLTRDSFFIIDKVPAWAASTKPTDNAAFDRRVAGVTLGRAQQEALRTPVPMLHSTVTSAPFPKSWKPDSASALRRAATSTFPKQRRESSSLLLWRTASCTMLQSCVCAQTAL